MIKIIQTRLMKKKRIQKFNTFKFSNNDVNKFTLLLRKGVYPNEIWMIGKA